MTSISRRPHTKSQNGCGQCKRRRVKCSLQGPICSNCFKRDEACDYLFRFASASHPHPHIPLWRTKAAPMLPRQWQDSILDGPQSAELMRTFIERTSLEFDLVIDSDPIWQRDAVQASVHFPFLQHALMALAGLHICHMSPPDPHRYYHLACHHAVRASELFRTSVISVSEQIWQPVLTFLIATVAFNLDAAFLAQTIGEPGRAISPASLLLMLRMPGALSTHFDIQMLPAPLAATLIRRKKRLRAPIDDNIIRKIDSLARFCETGMQFSPDAQANLDAVELLRTWTNAVSCQPWSWHDLVSWPVLVSSKYVENLQLGDAFAIVTFVYWCAIMSRAPRRYYLAGNMKKMEEVATADLDPSWNALLEWPRNELQGGPGYFV